MSSLAGALDDYSNQNVHSNYQPDDIEMSPTARSFNRISDPHAHGVTDDDEQMSDLFGNDSDVEEQKNRRSPASPTASGPESDRLASPERERRHALEYEEDDEAPPEIAVEVKEAEVKFPNLPVPKSSDNNNWVLRIPNFLKVEPKPFHPDTYIGPEHDEEEGALAENPQERSMSIKLKVGNTVRWRWNKDEYGQDVRESNGQVIRWSDGSLSLRLGKELFNITTTVDQSAVARQNIGNLSQSQSQSEAAPGPTPTIPGKSRGLTYLVAQHKRSQVLQSEAVITGYMSLRPVDMQSETHRMLVRAVGQRHNKVARLRMAPDPTVDPERQKMEMMKQSNKKTKRKAFDTDGLGSPRKRRGYRRTTDRDVLWSDDDDDVGGTYGANSDDDDDDDLGGSPRKTKRKSTDHKGEEDYQADDFVVPDEDEDDGQTSRRKRIRDAEEEEDDLEKMEARLERQAAAEKKNRTPSKKTKKKSDDEDSEEAEMDVESEEDEDEFGVRKVTTKRGVAFDDDDE
ncbi:Leo1-like protein-domain-containing protein [Panaeolus papilionaceus]|nr:Leo1-like protein-domain-containing protein [Panaeolus papilionaceus]